MRSPLAALRDLPAAEIASGLRSSGIIADGYVLAHDASVTFAAGRQERVDVLVGSNQDEGTFFTRSQPSAEQVKERLRQRFGDRAAAAMWLYPADTDAQAAASWLALMSDEIAWQMRKFAAAQADRAKPLICIGSRTCPPRAPASRPAARRTRPSWLTSSTI